MPVVKVDYEKNQISESDIKKLVESLQEITEYVTGYEAKENSIFASANQISANATPVEIYIQATFADATSEDLQSMLDRAGERIAGFKKENNIKVPINVSVVKMNWKFKIGI